MASIVKQFYLEDAKKNMVKAVPFGNKKEEAGANIKTIITGAIAVSIFILLIIIVNLLNLNAATTYTRIREVAVRRMIGSGKLNIVIQLCIENALIIITSLILSFFFFMNFLLPLVNAITGLGFGEMLFKWHHNYPLVIAFVVVGLIFVFIS